VTICAYHQRGLFNKICGALTASGLTIFNAQIFMRQDGIALNTFHVLNAEESDLPTERCRKEFAVILDRALMDAVNLEELVEKRYKNRPSFEPIPQEHFTIPTEVSFDQESARKYTIVQIQTEDFIGLLYTLTRALSRLGTDIVASHSFTEKGVAIDRFLITDCIGNKIIRPDRLRTIEAVLRQAIENLKLKAAQGKKLKENEI
jgi:[protein-PII] uridylyltransferase